MDFFTKEDFEYYTSVIGFTYKSGTPLAKELKTKLTNNGVFDKTKYWAQLIEENGYSIDAKNIWQDYLRVRSYTWAKIFVTGYEDSQICFTIGVGGRLTKNSKGCNLVYKLDCQRKKSSLSKYQIELFDQYISENKLDYVRFITKEELEDNDWDKLTLLTLKFIEEFKEHYLKLVELVWPYGVGVKPKMARLCWNEYAWEKPSGNIGKSKNKGHAFESDKGYGHEEWLFDLDRVIDGYHYGFIQAFNKGDHSGKIFDVNLFSIKTPEDKHGNKEYYWIARINRAEVITPIEKEIILEKYKEKGWYAEMLKELKNVGVLERDLSIVNEEDLFNVKFKVDQDSFQKFEEPILIENPSREIGKGLHYVLMDLITETKSVINSSRAFNFKSGHNPTKTGSSKSKYKVKTVNRTLIHKEIQEHMYNQLVKLYDKESVGTENTTGFGTSIDVVVKLDNDNHIFYEVKTSNSALGCIREGLGQVLEYAIYPEKSLASKMVIVSQNFPDQSVKDYMEFLRNKTSLELYYQVFDLEAKKLLPTHY